MLTHKGTQTIETDRLILRRFKITDCDDMYNNWASDDEVTRFITWPTHSNLDVTKKVVTDWINAYEKDDCYNWAMELKDIHEVVGGISAFDVNEDYYSCEIGYCMSKKYWNMGIMTEALKAVINHLFTQVGMNRIIAKHDTNNPASGKVMGKSGMIIEGIMRQVKKNKNNEFCDLAQYAILKDDWLENNERRSQNV